MKHPKALTRAKQIVVASLATIGTTCSVVATDPSTLLPAVTIARDELNALDVTASRFQTDSELSRINAGRVR